MNILNNVTFEQFQKLLDKHPHINAMFAHAIENPPPENSMAAAYGLSGSLVETLNSVHGKDKVCEMIQIGLEINSKVSLEKGFDGNYTAFVDEGTELKTQPANAGNKLSLLLLNQLLHTTPEKAKGVKNEAALATLICMGVLDKKSAKQLGEDGQLFVDDFFYKALKIENAIDNQVLRFNVTASLGDTHGQVASYETPSGTPFHALEVMSIDKTKYNLLNQVFGEAELDYQIKARTRWVAGLNKGGQQTILFANGHDDGDIKVLVVVDESQVGKDLGGQAFWHAMANEINHGFNAKIKALRPQDTAHVKDPAALETLAKMAIVESGFNSKLKVLQDKGVVPVREKAGDSPSLG